MKCYTYMLTTWAFRISFPSEFSSSSVHVVDFVRDRAAHFLVGPTSNDQFVSGAELFWKRVWLVDRDWICNLRGKRCLQISDQIECANDFSLPKWGMEPKTNSGQVETILCSSRAFGYSTPFQSSGRQVGRLRTLQAALDGNLFFLQLYTEVGGFLDAVHELRGFVAIWFSNVANAFSWGG